MQTRAELIEQLPAEYDLKPYRVKVRAVRSMMRNHIPLSELEKKDSEKSKIPLTEDVYDFEEILGMQEVEGVDCFEVKFLNDVVPVSAVRAPKEFIVESLKKNNPEDLKKWMNKYGATHDATFKKVEEEDDLRIKEAQKEYDSDQQMIKNFASIMKEIALLKKQMSLKEDKKQTESTEVEK